MRIKTVGYFCLVTSLFTGALVPVVLSWAKEANLVEFFFLTYLLGIVVAATTTLVAGKRKEAASYFTQPRRLALVAFVGLLVYLPFEVVVLYAEHYVTAALATVVFRTSPLLMLALIPTLLRERLTRNQVVALALAFFGIFVALTGGNPLGFFGAPDLPIILLLLLAAFAYALSSLLMKRYVFDLSSELLIFNVALFVVFAVAFLSMGAQFRALSLADIGVILFISADNIVGFFMYFYAFRLLKTTVVTNVYFSSPFISLLLANILLGEVVQPYYVLIAILVTVGLVIQSRDRIGGTYLPKYPSKLGSFYVVDVSGAFANTKEGVIASSLGSGGRVMAVKIPSKNKAEAERRVRNGTYSNFFMGDNGRIAGETNFVGDILHVNPDDLVLMKVGSFDECEKFFGELADLIAD
ncbi:MAG: EamA family transporter [Nitrososphaerota archaeon]|nr:EamA family transporter [Nitrososphaerota archaeon]